MNKLDEILENLYSNGFSAGRCSEIAKLSLINRYRYKDLKEAKQAIIELIEGEIKEELEEVDSSSDEVNKMVEYSNKTLEILLLKLQKLKD